MLSKARQAALDARMFGRFAFGLPRFLRSPIQPDRCADLLKDRLERREESFLSLIKGAVYANRSSPYLRLLQEADVDFEEIVKLVSREGIEATLEYLFDAGIYVTLDELKGRRPIRRSGFEFAAKASHFDNPLLTSHFEGATGGSRGPGSRLIVDLDLIAGDAPTHSLFMKAFDLASSPMALWRPLPPGVAGVKKALMQSKLDKGIERWFSQNPHQLTPGNGRYFLFLSCALQMSRLFGVPLPRPEFVPVAEPAPVAEWLAQKTAGGSPGHLDTNATCGVRVLHAAKDGGFDISGSFFRFGGEPYTTAKADLVAEAGCRAACHYSMGEVGPVGIACADAIEVDDVHLIGHKIAILQKPIVTSLSQYDAFYITTLAPACPKIMLNVACGDNGVLESRVCNCALGKVGFKQHIHSIRSYEKLTSEGMQFLGTDLLLLLEQVLPNRFGGGPNDYQFVEMEEAGVTRVQLIASTRLGSLDEGKLLETALEFLGSRARENRMMAERWKEGKVLVVKRSEPYVTKASKLLPLHILPKNR